MTATEKIKESQKEPHEKPHDYFVRMVNATGYSYNSIKTAYYRISKQDREVQGLTLSKVVEHPGGSETTTYTRQSDEVDTSGLEVERVTTSPNGGQWVKYKAADELTPKKIDEIVSKAFERHPIKPIKVKRLKTSNKKQLNVVITDDHIGIDTNPEKIGLFAYKYDKATYQQKIIDVISIILKEVDYHGEFDEIVINNLGDLEDGWNGYTTRGGHQLPQNLTNEQTFDIAVDTRLMIIRALVDYQAAKKIVMRVVTNSNHSASFAIIVAKTIEKMCNHMYSDNLVEVDILKKFIEHRIFGNHCFLLTHGKDKKEMKSGLPLVLNEKTINYIRSYIDYHKIKSDNIHLWKGDSHRFAVTSNKTFTYTSFRTFAPVSNWIGTNFGDQYHPGYSIVIVDKETNEVNETHHKINYEKIISKKDA